MAAPRTIRSEQIFLGFVFVATMVMLRSVTPFSFKQGLVVIGLACVTSLPVGWLLVRALAPGIQSTSVRAALTTVVGYVASIFLGFFLGVVGLQWLYLPLCLVCLGIWLWRVVVRARAGSSRRRGFELLTAVGLVQAWDSSAPWIVLAIGLLSVAAATPLMSPLVRVAPNSYMDYAFTDNYYHMIRAQLLGQGAPLSIWPDLAGVKPLVYPDFHDFWMGQLAHWTRASVRDVYFVYVPIVMILSNTVLLYAIGQQLTGSRWGGYVAAALAYLVLVPNPYDTNFFLRSNIDTWPEWTASRIHFLDMRSNLAYGAAWQVLTAVALIFVVYPHHRDSRRGWGLLVIGGLLIVALLRIRSHFFVAAAPAYLLFLVGALIRQKRWQYLAPIVSFIALFGLIFVESTSAHYDLSTARLTVTYGLLGDAVIPWLPAQLRSMLPDLPGLVRPAVSILVYTFAQMVGFVFSCALLLRLIQAIRNRQRPSLLEWYLLSVFATAILAAMWIGFDAYRDGGGNWGAQILFIAPRLGLLLTIVPLYRLLDAIVQKASFVNANCKTISLGLVLTFTVVSYRGAEAALHNQTFRAYHVTFLELDTYNWLIHHTPETAVIAANPKHKVNLAGQTITQTAFLSGMTMRPMYLQMVVAFSNEYEEEAQRRAKLLERLFDTSSIEEVKSILEAAPFDYLLVYWDTPAVVDLACCLRLVHDGEPQVYEVVAQ